MPSPADLLSLAKPSQSTVPPAQTLASVQLLLDSDVTLQPEHRRSMGGAIRTVCDIVGRRATSVPADLAAIDTLLHAVPRAVHGRSGKTLANVRSQLKRALAVGMGSPISPPPGTPLTPAWAQLASAVESDSAMRIGLSRLFRISSYYGLDPEAMSDIALDGIVAVVRSTNWGRDATPFRRKVVALWNAAAQTFPRWPANVLTPPPPSTKRTHLELSDFPESFQRDVEEYLAWVGGTDLFASDPPPTALRASTLRLRRSQLVAAASTLALHLDGPVNVTSLDVLVKPAHVKAILTSYLGQKKEPPSAYAQGLSVMLKVVAKHWVKLPAADLEQLAHYRRQLGSPPSGLTTKNRGTMRQLQDPAVLDKLYAVPASLRAQARKGRLSSARKLQKMQIALAIDLLIHIPMRLHNLASLELDRHLRWPTGRNGKLYIHLLAHETKNNQSLEYEVPAEVRAHLADYLDTIRPRTSCPSLFVRESGTAMLPPALRDGISKAVKREVGISMTPHQFRHLAAEVILDNDPGAMPMVRDLLGHVNLATTINAYAGRRTTQAGRAFDEILVRRAANGLEVA